MKFLLTILCFFVVGFLNAQDTCSLAFDVAMGEVSNLHKDKIEKFIAGQKVRSVQILAPVLKAKGASKNRFTAEERVQSVRQTLQFLGVSFGKIEAKVYLTEDVEFWNTVQLAFNFEPLKEERVLKSTPVVQISEVQYNAPIRVPEKTKEVIEQEEAMETVKKNEMLSVDDFKKNETINLPNLLFEGGTHFILPGTERVLNELVAVMKAKPKLSIELQGHICCKMGGMDGYDATTGMENLSVMRAKVVYLYLISKGIDQNRMSFKGFGSSRKLYPDDLFNTANAMQNRRVEVLVLGDE